MARIELKRSRPPSKISSSPGAHHSDETPPSADLVAGVAVGDYVIERKLGEGGMGTVYAALHPVIGKRAAVKVMAPRLCVDANAVERFVREARAVNQIGHPNIVDVFAFGALPDGRSYFVMEWLQGETLAERLARGRLPLPECHEILLQVCDALGAAHDHGIVHRDLKPENIFLVPVRGRRQMVKLLDFGIAKLVDGEPGGPSATHSQQGGWVGTPLYMSPEQARSRGVDRRSDIYALGVTAYEMILGAVPFQGETAIDVLRAHLSDPPPRPSVVWPEVPAAIEWMLLHMLEKAPERRPPLDKVVAWLAEHKAQFASDDTVVSPPPQLESAVISPTVTAPEPVAAVTPEPATATAIATPIPTPTPAATPEPATVIATPPADATVATPKPASAPAVVNAITAPLGVPAISPQPRRKWALLIGAGVLLTVGALVGGLLVRDARRAPNATPTTATPTTATPRTAPPTVATPTTATTPTAPPATATPAAPEPAQLALDVNVPARITLDGRELAISVARLTIPIRDPGPHDLAVTAPHRRPYHGVVVTAPGQHVDLKVTLSAAPPSTKTPHRNDMLDPFAK